MGKKISAFIAVVLLVQLAVSMVITGCSRSTPAPAGTPAPATPAPVQEAVTRDVSPAEAYALIQDNRNNKDFVILDVRTPAEYSGGHLENAVNVDSSAADFRDRINGFDKNQTYLVYCRTGARSAAARDAMMGLGFKNVYNMTGGIMDWQAADYPVVK
ncbi:MAG: rhodanese-like domain-containing protein [Chloroflexota bacterium]